MAPARMPKHSPEAWLPLSGYQHAGNGVSERVADWVIFLCVAFRGVSTRLAENTITQTDTHSHREKTLWKRRDSSVTLTSPLCVNRQMAWLCSSLFHHLTHTVAVFVFQAVSGTWSRLSTHEAWTTWTHVRGSSVINEAHWVLRVSCVWICWWCHQIFLSVVS